ncbi:MAG: ATP-binding cassette domain-containing protein [Candidatus Cardinium sp.]|uniref:ABC transporter ATP-binding protein n=1 Tax=Cardinium endosymbiont of Dermatophagoides farinae TaxID=2597823 RepID=UPI001182F183|nr:oligopeptide/dipeptide ABC transporter ATP-binding protein [Cardinium endosymbiont of Dermatophagoides farinae]TSJ81006.1 ATP-binding cassette domain-containing protein [Cardinium endosymbiont of Dermatophagoides farinae]UWW97032.1 MAG: ATP-binding cassette domain-containing protein [Candidatus Cardinium sp.]
MQANTEILLKVDHLCKTFPVKHHLLGHTIGKVSAVNDVSFTLYKGETLGLVGESGCGKTTLGRTILRLIEPTSGRIIFDGVDITHCSAGQMRSIRRKMQIIFQDPYAALNPRMAIRQILEEPIKIHHLADGKAAATNRIYQLLDYVRLPRATLCKYPHELSGGQRQRICIARALAVEPAFIVCDEAIAALDVSVQAQVINLLMDLQDELGLTYLFISHDLRVVEFIANHVAVMYLGKIVETASAAEIYKNPKHPYTKALFSAIPAIHPAKHKERIILQGDVPSPRELPSGCYFHPRCWKAAAQCAAIHPALIQTEEENHQVACHFPETN